MCECGHEKSKHHHGWHYGLETYYCEVCGCPEYSEVSEEDLDSDE